MATSTRHIDASPEAVFGVVAEAGTFADWVVGAKKVRDADPHWPEPGAKLHHTQGAAFLVWRDSTSVVEAERPHRLLMEARVRPFLVNHVELVIEPRGGGSHVTMNEVPIGGAIKRLYGGPLDRVLRRRNDVALRRLEELSRKARASS